MISVVENPRVTVRAPGKVNLELTVGLPDPQGMHPLATVFQAVSIYEEVTATPRARGMGISISVRGRDADQVPRDQRNIVFQAAVRLAQAAGIVVDGGVPDVHLHIEKQVPVGGGMAGGSADGAAALVACNELWGAGLAQPDLDGIAAELGADTTFCLHGGTAVARGYGEQLAPVLSAGEYWWLFVLSDTPIATGAAYRELDRATRDVRDPLRVRPELMAALRGGDAEAVGRELRNDFHDFALRSQPALGQIVETALENGAAGAIVSGSGPTIAILAPTLYQQREIKSILQARNPDLEILAATGPVPGARVVG